MISFDEKVVKESTRQFGVRRRGYLKPFVIRGVKCGKSSFHTDNLIAIVSRKRRERWQRCRSPLGVACADWCCDEDEKKGGF